MKYNHKNCRYKLRRKGNTQVLVKLSNMFMKNGTKALGLNVLFSLLRHLKIQLGTDPYPVLIEAIKNVSPVAELRPKVMGRVTYKIPFPVSKKREMGIGIKNIVKNLSSRTEPTLFLKLSGEILDSYSKKSNSYKQKLELNKQIKQNRSLVRLVSLV